MARNGRPKATTSTTRHLIATVCSRRPERFSYQIVKSCCWQLGWATNCWSRQREVGYQAIVDSSATECVCILKILMHIFPEHRHWKLPVIFSFTFPPFFKIASELLQELRWKHEVKLIVSLIIVLSDRHSPSLQTPLWNLGDIHFPLWKRVRSCCLPAHLHSVQNGKENSYLVYCIL